MCETAFDLMQVFSDFCKRTFRHGLTTNDQVYTGGVFVGLVFSDFCKRTFRHGLTTNDQVYTGGVFVGLSDDREFCWLGLEPV